MPQDTEFSRDDALKVAAACGLGLANAENLYLALAAFSSTAVTSARALDTTFVPNSAKYTLVVYTVRLEADSLESGIVELRSDTASPPTTVRVSGEAAFSVGGVLGVIGSAAIRQQLTYIVPPGHTVRLVTSGTADITLIHQTEMTLS